MGSEVDYHLIRHNLALVSEHTRLLAEKSESSNIDYDSVSNAMTLRHHTGHHQQRTLDRNNDDDDEDFENLPAILRITLGILGLWFPTTATRSYTSWSNSSMDASHEQTNDGAQSSSLNGDAYNLSETERDNQTGAKKSKGRGCWCTDVFAFLYLSVVCGLMIYDFVAYVRFYWGVREDILHLVSYFTFLLQVMTIPFWCLYARILHHTIGPQARADYPLFQAFMCRRTQKLAKSRSGARAVSYSCLIMFMVWPTANGILRAINDYYFIRCGYANMSIHYKVSTWVSMIGYVLYGAFCYLTYIQRLSFESEARHITRFARERASVEDVNGTRQKIREFYAQYNVLRKQITKWMAFTMVIATWGLTAHLTWNYLIFSDKKLETKFLPNIRFLNLLVSSQKIMFFILPCVALGDLNLEHVMVKLKESIAACQDNQCEMYWTLINRFLIQINVGTPGGTTSTLIFSAIGLYLGLNLSSEHQDMKFWEGPGDCRNMTNI